MRFDEASAWYAEFGPFYVGLQFSPSELPKYLEGEVPAFLEAVSRRLPRHGGYTAGRTRCGLG